MVGPLFYRGLRRGPMPSSARDQSRRTGQGSGCSTRAHHVIERTFCRLRDWRRVVTRSDKLAQHSSATVLACRYSPLLAMSPEPKHTPVRRS